MSQQNSDIDMAEVYAYADSIGVTPQQVDAAIGNNTALRERLIAWKYLLHSLVNTGYTPWLQGDGVAYINTGIIPNSNIGYEIKYYAAGRFTMFGARTGGSGAYGYICRIQDAKKLQIAQGTTIIAVSNYNLTDKHTIAIQPNGNNFEVVLDGNIIYTDAAGSNTISYQTTLFAENRTTTPYIMHTNGNKLSSVKCWSNYGAANESLERHFVPYLDNGEYGMLDLVTGTFYGSAVQNGLFTYILEDSNGNQVNIN